MLSRNFRKLRNALSIRHYKEILDLKMRRIQDILFAKVLDAEDSRGMWIEVDRRKSTPDSGVDQFQLLIPWSEVLSLVVAKEFSSAIRQEARKIGFTGEMEPE